MFSKRYIAAHQDEYFKFITTTLRNFNAEYMRNVVLDSMATTLAKTLLDFSEIELGSLKLLPKALIEHKLAKHTDDLKHILSNRFYALLIVIWKKAYGLGVTHHTRDILYNVTALRKDLEQAKDAKFSSLLHGDLAEFAAGDESAINSEGLKREAERLKAQRAYNATNLALGKLKANIKRLREAGFYADLQTSNHVAARMSINQRAIFLETIKNVSDYNRQAKAMEQNFLSDNYLKTRYRVLANDYAKSYDNYVKTELQLFLKDNVQGMQQIRSRFPKVDEMARGIKEELRRARVPERINLSDKSSNIIRTELSLAYNFGKLSGFTSPADLDKKMQWKADFELEGRKAGYEVCPHCENMHNKIFTVRELLQLGATLDRSVGSYGRTPGVPSDWKNENRPMIPFHPNCSCFWVYISDSDALLEDIIHTASDNLPAVVGLGLIVAGAFLLSRGNVWRTFTTAARATTSSTATVAPIARMTTTDIVDDVIGAGEIIEAVAGKPARTTYANIIIPLVQTAASVTQEAVEDTVTIPINPNFTS